MEQVELEPQTNPAKYHHVAEWKFLLLGIVTFGLYELYWFYKNWKYIRERDQRKILPFWRAFFAPIWFYSLAEDIEEETTAQNATTVSGVLALLYFLLAASWRLPDPYWLICSFTPFVVLPLVRNVHAINHAAGITGAAYSRFSIKHILTTAVGLPILVINIFLSTGQLPSTQVMSGDQLPDRVVTMLESKGLLQEGEEVIYYYSSAFTFGGDGNFFTENQVVSYWREQGELYAMQASYEEIEDIKVEYSDSYPDDSQLTILRKDGTEFFLWVSAEEEKDHEFVAALRRLWKESA